MTDGELTKKNIPPSFLLMSLAILGAILSTLAVQISMLHYSPFIRTIQCYFNNKILEHTSVDIYQSIEVIYYRTDSYNLLPDVYSFFDRFATTVMDFDSDGFINVNNLKRGVIQMQAQYIGKQIGSNTIYYQNPIYQLRNMFVSTTFNRTFYQHLKEIRISLLIPIEQYQGFDSINLQLSCQFDSNLLMSVQIDVNPMLEEDYYKFSKKQNNKNNDNPLPKIRKLTDHNKLSLTLFYLPYLIVLMNAIILIFQLIPLFKITIPKIPQQFQLQQPIQQISILNNIKNLENLKIIALIVSVISLLMYFAGNGYVCLLCWTRLTVYISHSNNPFIFGFLMKKALPIYLKLILNLAIILTAFVLFSMINYTLTIKFESLKLSYYQYLFNYFQYGIYQNFMALLPYNYPAMFLYFVQTVILVSIGNNILQSILAGQLLKTSNYRDLKQLLEQINCQCPMCFAPAKGNKKIEIKVQKKNRLISRIIQSNLAHQQSQYDYQINIKSPNISPYFHPQKTKIKTSKKRKNSIYQNQQNDKKLIFEIGEDVKVQDNLVQHYISQIKSHKITFFQILEKIKKQQSQYSIYFNKEFKQFLTKSLNRINNIKQFYQQKQH